MHFHEPNTLCNWGKISVEGNNVINQSYIYCKLNHSLKKKEVVPCHILCIFLSLGCSHPQFCWYEFVAFPIRPPPYMAPVLAWLRRAARPGFWEVLERRAAAMAIAWAAGPKPTAWVSSRLEAPAPPAPLLTPSPVVARPDPNPE
mmetsp:Transcript_12572/g.16347  ORF Transcript_12572/g.16347 Transcript_12572/m.16347 type:complete len:145 (+) Transcript_12572:216-650(+)